MKTDNHVNLILKQVRNRISILESEQSALRAQAEYLKYGSKEYILNEKESARIHGELCGLAYSEGALEVWEERPPQGVFQIGAHLDFSEAKLVTPEINDEVPF